MAHQRELFIIIDANSLIHRAYHALPRLNTQHGELTNAVFGFSSVLLKALKEFRPDYLVAAFDVAGPTFRAEEYEAYKGTRVKAPDDLYAQIPRVKDVLSTFRIPVYEQQGFEADDIIGTVAHTLNTEHGDIDVLIVSGDLDTLQLVTKRTRVFTLKKGVQDTIIYDEKAVKERFSIQPEHLPDYKGLRGDASDNIPGVPGIGEKTASALIAEFVSLEKLYEMLEKDRVSSVSPRIQGILLEHKEQAFFSRMLATIRRDVPLSFNIDEARWGGFDEEAVRQMFRDLGFSSLIGRLGDVQGFTDRPEEASNNSSRQEELMQDVEEARAAGVLSDRLYELEKDLVPIIIGMEERGIRIDQEALQEMQRAAEGDIHGIEQKIYQSAGLEFNINSPKQLSELLFNTLGISTKGLKKTPGREISTAADELEKIRGEHEVVELVLKHRELQKLLSTYIRPLPTLADAAGRIHTTFRPLGAATGRMSSNNPNLQNIPLHGELAHTIREAFIPGDGYIFLACDYSQMELRVVAHLAKDKNMIATFRRGEDIHASTAAHVFGIELDQVTSDMRYRAKALNFGLIYGIGERAFAASAGISLPEAREFMDRYLEVFNGVAEYMKATKEKAHQLGYVETLYGRKRFLPDLRSPNPRVRSMAERAAINMPVQGTAADLVKMAMVKSENELSGARLLLQLHDELLWEVPQGKEKALARQARSVLQEIDALDVPLHVDAKIGHSWGALEQVKDGK
ncbi:MAG: DNA polymerase [Candidatus Spechtbacterales bacterium]